MDAQLTETTTLDRIYQPVLSELGQLLAAIRTGSAIGRDFYETACLLESLPLATDEFGLARTRLGNASRYWHTNERGAATWEVCTLMKQIQNKATTKTVEPRRRSLNL